MKFCLINKITTQLLMTVMLTTTTMAQVAKPAKDFVGVAGPLTFNNQPFLLNWSSHPSANFYKQEYLKKGTNADKYQSMLLIDVLTGSQDLNAVVAAKKQELENMKAANPLINYGVIHNSKSGEYIIDFVLSANAADGSISIIEHNVYRYAVFTDNGKKGVQLFGLSTRGYGKEADAFLAKLKTTRQELINSVVKFSLPVIHIK